MAGANGNLESYARQHKLKAAENASVGALTPLLARGGGFEVAFTGKLPGGLEGTLARYSYSAGMGFTFTVAMSEIPESTEFVPRIACEQRGRHETNIHYGFEIRSDKLWQESVALNDRYVITTGAFQDDNWMRQLFSPALIDYLAKEPPKGFSFELTYGTYLASIEEDDPSTEALDAFCEAASHVAERLRAECHE
jgi:hypothetical protein